MQFFPSCFAIFVSMHALFNYQLFLKCILLYFFQSTNLREKLAFTCKKKEKNLQIYSKLQCLKLHHIIKKNYKPLNFFDIFRKYHNPQLSPLIYQIKSLFLIGITTQKTEVFFILMFVTQLPVNMQNLLLKTPSNSQSISYLNIF